MLTWSDIQLGLQQAGLLLDVIVLETKGKSMSTHTNVRTKQRHKITQADRDNLAEEA